MFLIFIISKNLQKSYGHREYFMALDIKYSQRVDKLHNFSGLNCATCPAVVNQFDFSVRLIH